MVDGVSRVNAGVSPEVVGGGDKLPNRGARPQEVVPVGASKKDPAKGTSVQTGNPYFAKLPEDYFMDLKPSERDDARKEANNVRTRLAIAYANVLREKPDALVGVELPPFPEVPTDCKKKDRLDTYLDALRNHEIMVTVLLNAEKGDTIVERVNANTDMRAAETRALVVASTTAVLGKIFDVQLQLDAAQQEIMASLKDIYNLVEVGTLKIIDAVDDQGERVIVALDEATDEIKSCIADEGDIIRWDAFFNTLGLHQQMDYNTTWLGLKIDDQGQWTRQHVSHEHNISRQFIHEEHEATRSVAAGVPYSMVEPPEVPVSPEDGGGTPWWTPFFGPPAQVGVVPYGAPVATPSSTGSPVTGATGAPDDNVGSTGYMTPVGKDGETPTETKVEVPKENNSNPPNSGDIGTGVGEVSPKASVFKGFFRADK